MLKTLVTPENRTKWKNLQPEANTSAAWTISPPGALYRTTLQTPLSAALSEQLCRTWSNKKNPHQSCFRIRLKTPAKAGISQKIFTSPVPSAAMLRPSAVCLYNPSAEKRSARSVGNITLYININKLQKHKKSIFFKKIFSVFFKQLFIDGSWRKKSFKVTRNSPISGTDIGTGGVFISVFSACKLEL